MQRAADFVADIIKAVEYPCLQINDSGDNSATVAQGYHVQVWRGKLAVRAETALGAAYGACRSLIAWRGQVTEWLGDQQPRYENRLLWIEGENAVKLNSALTLALPRSIAQSVSSAQLEETVVMLCQKTIELGFNGLILGSLFNDALEDGDLSQQQCSLIDQIIAEFGLRLFLMPLLAGASINYSVLFDVFPKCSGVVYRCMQLEKQPQAITCLEKLVIQIASIRHAVPDSKELLCYLPLDVLPCQYNRHSRIWSQLCDALPSNTTLVFSAAAAEPPSLAAAPHPFWDELRRSADISGAPLLPLLNIGAIGCGGGLWPLSLTATIENTIVQCRRHYFSGVIAVVPAMPKAGGLAHSNLWVMGQRLWKCEASASELMALWFDIYRPDVNYPKAAPLLAEAAAVALEAMALFSCAAVKSHDQWRAVLESSFARLKNLLHQVWDELHYTLPTSLPSLKELFGPFYVDMRRLLFKLMLAQQVNLPQIVEDSDLAAGFWTKLNAVRGQSVRAGAEIVCAKNCRVEELTPDLQRLYRSIYFD